MMRNIAFACTDIVEEEKEYCVKDWVWLVHWYFVTASVCKILLNNWGLSKGAKRLQRNSDFMNKIEANDLRWVRQLSIMDKGHNFNNFTTIGWANGGEGNRNKKTHAYVDWNVLI